MYVNGGVGKDVKYKEIVGRKYMRGEGCIGQISVQTFLNNSTFIAEIYLLGNR